jgi:flagellar biogenesis protein FliO
MFWQLLYALFLFGLVLVLAWLSTRLVGYRMGLGTRGRMVRVLEQVPAGRERMIMLLEVGGRIYLVGSTSDQISLIDAIDDPAVIERLLAHAPEAEAHPLPGALPVSFRDLLAKVRPFGQNQPQSQQPQPPADAAAAGEEERRLQEQLERLRRLQQK